MAKKQLSFKVLGVKATQAYLKAKDGQAGSLIKKAMTQATLFLEGEVKGSIAGRKAEPRSVDTGRFMGSVTSKSSSTQGVVSSDVKYSPVLEYGGAGRTGRKHFRNSLSRNQGKIKEYFKDKLRTL